MPEGCFEKNQPLFRQKISSDAKIVLTTPRIFGIINEMIRGFYLRRLCLMSIKREKLKNVSFAPAPAVCRQHTSGTSEKAKNVSFFETKRV